jgi:membrane-bound metal-dependent hydrolase YbcI (DUF457 family)
MAAFILGSLFPDVDAALVFRGFDTYLHAHASGTHSVIGTLAGAIIVGLTVRACTRGSRLAPLIGAAWIGTIGHVVCDLANGSDIRCLAPFSSRSFGWHLVAMGEPIVLIILILGLAVTWTRRSPGGASIAVLATLTAFLLFKAATQSKARSVFADTRRGANATVVVTPRLGSLFEWTFVERRDDDVRAWTVNARTGSVSPDFTRRDATGFAVVSSRKLPVVRTFLDIARLPFVRVEQDGNRQLVLWSDAATCSAQRCDVSFGAAFDPDGALLSQIVRVGGFIERRPLPAAP